MAADNPNVIAFELEADSFTLKKTSAGVEFLVNGESMIKDLPGAKINRETREAFFMGRNAGKLDASQDVEALASKFEAWYPPGVVHHVHTVADFDNRKGNGIVVAKFSAEWCGPCKMVAPAIDAMSLKYPDVAFLHIDGDKLKSLMRREGATAYPTFMFWKNGQKKTKKIEGADAADVEATIKNLGAIAVEAQNTDVADEELTIVVERDSYVVEKEAEGVSLTVDGKKVLPAGKCPDLEINRSTRKVAIGRGGGVLFDSPNYSVVEVMDKIEAMFPNRVRHVHSAAEFDEIVQNNTNVVAKFSANWCGPCHAVAPFVKKLSLKHENVVFLHIDVDEAKELSQREGVKAMPTFDFWKNGKKQVGQTIRGGDTNRLRKQVEACGEN